MENNNKTITFTEREILLLFRGVNEYLGSLEESLDDCYSCGDLECADQVLKVVEELGVLSRRLAPFASVGSLLGQSKVGD